MRDTTSAQVLSALDALVPDLSRPHSGDA